MPYGIALRALLSGGGGTPGTGNGVSTYDLEARFNVSNQAFSDGQVLGVSEGVEQGSLTIVEVDGTLAISNLGVAFTGQSTPTWGDLGWVGPAVTRAFGKALFGRMWIDNTDTGSTMPLILLSTDTLAAANRVYYINCAFDGAITPSRGNAADSHKPMVRERDSLLYDFAIVLGGYDSSGNPWTSGSTSGYEYGASFFIKPPWANWRLAWRSREDSTATLYPGLYISNSHGLLDTFLVPVDGISNDHVQVNQHDTFTNTDGTALDTHSPDVGSGYTVTNGAIEVQSNQIVPTSGSSRVNVGVVDTVQNDVLIEVDVTYDNDLARHGGVALRQQDANNRWEVRLSNDQLLISERTSGSPTTRASEAVTLTNGNTYRLVVSAIGDRLAATVNNVNITYDSTTYQSETEHGPFFITDASYGAGNLAIDNLTIYPVEDSNYETVLEGIDDKDVTVRRAALEYYQRPARRFSSTHNRTYFAWIGFDGQIWVNYYDHTGGAYGTAVAVDDLYADYGLEAINDHNAPTLYILPSGKIQLYYSVHRENDRMWMSQSTSAEDISAWDTPVELDDSATTMHNYPQVHRDNSGNLILFYRRGDAATSEWYFKTSSNDGASWGSPEQLTNFGAGVGTYWYSTSSGNEIHLAGFKYDGSTRMDVYYFYTDDGGTTWRTIDGSAVTLPVAEADVDTVFDSSTEDCRAQDIVLDATGDPHILLIHDVSGTTPTFKYASHNGTSWDVSTITTTSLILDANFYSPGIAFDPSDETVVYLSTPTDSILEIEKWTTADGGSSWSRSESITSGSEVHQFRVQAVLNPAADFNLLWMSGAYDGALDYEWVGYGRCDLQLGGTSLP